MASKAQVGRGTKVFILGVTGAGGSPTPVPIGELETANFTGTSVGTVDVTNFDSGVDDEFSATTRNNGMLSLTGNDIPTDPGQIALYAAYGSMLKYDFKVQKPAGVGYTTGEIRTFSGIVVKYEDNIALREALKISVDIKISGPVTITAPVASA